MNLLFLAFAMTQSPPIVTVGNPLVATVAIRSLPDVFEDAYNDCVKLPPDVAAYTRYFDIRLEDDPVAYKQFFDTYVNGLSTSPKLRPVRRVNDYIWAVDIRWYRWTPQFWEAVGAADRYYQTETATVKFHGEPPKVIPLESNKILPGVVDDPNPKTPRQNNSNFAGNRPNAQPKPEPETPKVEVKVEPQPAPYVVKNYLTGKPDPALNIALINMTQSNFPVIRCDWFVNQTGIAVDRKETGYFAALGIKNRADFDKIIGFNQELSEKLGGEYGEVYVKSGVAESNRIVIRYMTPKGPVWVTYDTRNNKDQRNAVRNLFKMKFDAVEIVATLPNGLPIFFIGNDKGDIVESVPDFIAGDKKSSNNDPRIHISMSCWACHEGPLMTLGPAYMRKEFSPGTGKKRVDKESIEAQDRLEAVFIDSDIGELYKKDSLEFDLAIRKASGATIIEGKLVGGIDAKTFAKAFKDNWYKYVNNSITLEVAARELGVPKVIFRNALKNFKPNERVKEIDDILSRFADFDGHAITREDWEEEYRRAQFLIAGVIP